MPNINIRSNEKQFNGLVLRVTYFRSKYLRTIAVAASG